MSKKVTFIVNAETAAGANNGIVLGDFNQWNHEQGIPLKKQKDGSLKASADLEPGEYQYRYFLSDGRWVNDSNAHGYSHDGQYGVENCIVRVEADVKKQAVKPAKTEKTVPAAKEVKTAEKKAAEKKPVVVAPAKVAKKAPEKASPAKKVAEPKPAAKKAVAAKQIAKKAPAKPVAEIKKTAKKAKK